MPPALTQAMAVLAVGAIGMIALSATTAGARLAAAPGQIRVADVSATSAGAPVHMRWDIGAREGAAPAAKPAPHRSEPAPVRRTAPAARRAPAHAARKTVKWLPSGTGMWIYEWKRSNGGRPSAVVKRAKAVGLTHIFVRTGSSHDGYTGRDVLRAILPAAQKAHLAVIAWDFPELDHPQADAKRLARAAHYRLHGAHVAAVAPDIETPAEGTSSTPGAVRLYLKTLRKLLPKNVAILATVPWPSSERVGHYPYAIVAGHSDALLPMTYWYNNSPSAVTAASVKYLRRFHRPVMPVGQGYDGRLDVPWLPHNNLGRQVPAFFVTAHKLGVKAVSVWSWQSSPAVTWRALRSASRLFPVR
jgi:hypothetical protein